MKEKDLHNTIVEYLEHFPYILWTSTLGGVYLGKGNFKQKNLVKKHYKKGVPDILIFEPNKEYNGLMIELKVGKNKPSIHQKAWIQNLNNRGYKAIVCYTFEEFQDELKEYFNKI